MAVCIIWDLVCLAQESNVCGVTWVLGDYSQAQVFLMVVAHFISDSHCGCYIVQPSSHQRTPMLQGDAVCNERCVQWERDTQRHTQVELYSSQWWCSYQTDPLVNTDFFGMGIADVLVPADFSELLKALPFLYFPNWHFLAPFVCCELMTGGQ